MRVLLLLFLLTSCSDSQLDSDTDRSANTVWTVDLIRTLPGQQDNYIHSIEANWANARRIAKQRGHVLSFQAFMTPQDSARGWDILLMTEYADSTEWANREPTFQAIFESDEFVRVEAAKPSAEMRLFFGGSVAMHSFVNQ